MDFDGPLNMAEKLFLLVFFLLYFGAPACLVWVTYCNEGVFQKIDLRELWTHGGKPDKLAVIILGTWWVHTCTIILWTLTKQITTADFLTYMGWALPIIAQMLANKPPPEQSAPKTP